MWSCRLNKIKSGRTVSSIANSDEHAKKLQQESAGNGQATFHRSYFFSKIGHWQYLVELFMTSNVLALLIALAEAQSWSNLQATHVLGYVLYINWILLAFAALVDFFQNTLQKLSTAWNYVGSFFLLQMIVLLTTVILNLCHYLGMSLSLKGLSWGVLGQHLTLHLSYGVLIGAFCLRYIYMREQWVMQQTSELNARIQAMQARIHPHFLFNSLNSVVSLIGIDPDKAEEMLIDLSRLFRASLQELKLVSLKEEIELCQHYLAIEQIRLGDRLQVERNMPTVALLTEAQIPLLTLQPLLENSIFHGVEKKLSCGRVGILVEILQNQVTIVITNPFIQDRISLREGHGIALDNVKQRLKAHFGHSVQFRQVAGQNMFTTVVQYHYK